MSASTTSTPRPASGSGSAARCMCRRPIPISAASQSSPIRRRRRLRWSMDWNSARPAGRARSAGACGLARVARRRSDEAFAFYGELFGWQKADAETGSMRAPINCSRSAATRSAACSTNANESRFPFWLYYFNVDDIDVATQRVKSQGGRIFEGPLEVPGGAWIARCIDPQGAMFALQGGEAGRDSSAAGFEVGWSTELGRHFIARQVGEQAPAEA